jgi:hypothetical protein
VDGEGEIGTLSLIGKDIEKAVASMNWRSWFGKIL